MVTEYCEQSGILGGVARVLNFVGKSVVATYDTGRCLAGKTEILTLLKDIKLYERKKNKLSSRFGRLYLDSSNPMPESAVAKYVARIKEFDDKIQGLQDRVAAIKEQKILQSDLRKLRAVKRKAAPKTLTALQKVKTAIAEAVKNGEFDSVSEQATFEKVALDLLDKESEIRILAAMELGRMGNPAAVPILREALNLHDDKLTTEITISLKLIGVDAEAAAPVKEKTETEVAADEVAVEGVEAEAEEESAPGELDEKGLMKMLKADLLDLCVQRGIACEETMTKAQITELILSNQ